MSEVVRLDAGNDAVRAYVTGHASQGREHVVALVSGDNDIILGLIDGLSEDEATRVTPVDEWTATDVMAHLAPGLPRSKTRLALMSSGRPFTNPPVTPGQTSAIEYASFDALRSTYRDNMASIIDVLRRADPSSGLDLTADHAQYGPFNWIEWAVYSHHVHAHDHVGQLAAIRAALRG